VNIKHCLIITNVTVAMDSRVYTLELIILVNVYVFIWVCFVHRTLVLSTWWRVALYFY